MAIQKTSIGEKGGETEKKTDFFFYIMFLLSVYFPLFPQAQASIILSHPDIITVDQNPY